MKRFIGRAELPLPERYQQYLSAFKESGKNSLFNQDVLSEPKKSGRVTGELVMRKVEQCRDPLEWIVLTDMETYLPDDELRKADRFSI